jgi:hypothetical protein
MRLAAGPAYFPSNAGGGLDAAAANDPNCSLSFAAVDPQATVELIDLARDLGGIGGFSRPAAAVRENVRRARPALDLKPTAAEWHRLLPWLTNGTPAGTPPAVTTYPLATNRGSRRRLVLDFTSMVMELRGVQVERATLAAQAGAELTAQVQCVAVDFAVGGGFPAAGVPLLDGPRFLMRDASVLVGPAGGEAAYPCRSFSTTIAYTPAGDRVFNAATDDPCNADREVTLELEVPLGAGQALWGGGGSPVRVRVPFVAVVSPVGPKTVSLVLTYPAAVFPVPPVAARVADREAFFRVAATAHTADAASPDTELVVTVESDPAD